MHRRRFGQILLAGSTLPLRTLQERPSGEGPTDTSGLTDIEGIRVGHFTHPARPTGCTVVLTEAGAVAGVDVRGSAPGTRETDLLSPVNTVDEVHAVLLAGGSAFGLDAASGVVRYLAERDIGFPTRAASVPIVPAAILYDLGVGDPAIRPDAEAGYAACLAAGTGPVAEGNVGAGAGATVGKMMGMDRAMKGGLGTAGFTLPGGVRVAALVAVNCVGNVVDPRTGEIVAGIRDGSGGFVDTRQVGRNTEAESPLAGILEPTPSPIGENTTIGPIGENTTIGIVATNAVFSKTEMTKVAQMAHDGFARAIYPSHTPSDGDTIFALSTGDAGPAGLGAVGALAAEVMAEAILRAVKQAASIPGFPAYSDYPPR